MQYSKPMIELVYEIRRRVPQERKPAIKMANPELFEELITHYREEASTISRALIKELLVLAGPDWSERLESNEKSDDRYVARVYRGQARLEKVTASASEQNTLARSERPKKIYRGRVVS